jgi:6-pyruvoyltetrahydropterin 2'-reductase
MSKLIRYSEMFVSMQGEAFQVGEPSLWLRFFGCNLQCAGFGNSGVESHLDSYIKIAKATSNDIGVEQLTAEQFSLGCDSAYSWAGPFKKLQKNETPEEVVDNLLDLLPSYVPSSKFNMTFTGGEPFLPVNQEAMLSILQEFQKRNIVFKKFCFETNGTQVLSKEFVFEFKRLVGDVPVEINVSPKLESVSGEKSEKAIIPGAFDNLISEFPTNLSIGYKFVVDWNISSIRDLKAAIDKLGIEQNGNFKIALMPVGADLEQQNKIEHSIADYALSRGFMFSPRLQVEVYNNAIGA